MRISDSYNALLLHRISGCGPHAALRKAPKHKGCTMQHAGIELTRHAEIPWQARVNVDGWPNRAGMYFDDPVTKLCIRIVDYPVGSVEPRHVHAGFHATTVLQNRAIVDGLTLRPLDVIIGPSNEPHGPLDYPEGCKLLSAFQGSYFHSEVEQLSGKKEYRLIEQAKLPWRNCGNGIKAKTLVDHGCGDLLVEVLNFAPGASIARHASARLLTALVIEGDVVVGKHKLGVWDFISVPKGMMHGPVSFPAGATLLALSLP
jgi:quercetin dioxygenase-like cupin family protein